MSPRKKKKTLSKSPKAPVEESPDVSMDSPKVTKKARLASDAFHSDSSVESPARKKQNTKTPSLSTTVPTHRDIIKPAAEITTSSCTEKLVKETPTKYESDENNKDDSVLDVAPSIESIPVNPTSIVSNGTDALTTESVPVADELITAPSEATDRENLESSVTDVVCDEEILRAPERGTRGCCSRIGLLIFVNIVVLSVIAWSGLLLQEHSMYQLELAACKDRLRQFNHAMGITEEGDDDGTSGSRLQEQMFYWREIEAQVSYWKKEAKKHQQYGEGYKKQCENDLLEMKN